MLKHVFVAAALAISQPQTVGIDLPSRTCKPVHTYANASVGSADWMGLACPASDEQDNVWVFPPSKFELRLDIAQVLERPLCDPLRRVFSRAADGNGDGDQSYPIPKRDLATGILRRYNAAVAELLRASKSALLVAAAAPSDSSYELVEHRIKYLKYAFLSMNDPLGLDIEPWVERLHSYLEEYASLVDEIWHTGIGRGSAIVHHDPDAAMRWLRWAEHEARDLARTADKEICSAELALMQRPVIRLYGEAPLVVLKSGARSVDLDDACNAPRSCQSILDIAYVEPPSRLSNLRSEMEVDRKSQPHYVNPTFARAGTDRWSMVGGGIDVTRGAICEGIIQRGDGNSYALRTSGSIETDVRYWHYESVADQGSIPVRSDCFASCRSVAALLKDEDSRDLFFSLDTWTPAFWNHVHSTLRLACVSQESDEEHVARLHGVVVALKAREIIQRALQNNLTDGLSRAGILKKRSTGQTSRCEGADDFWKYEILRNFYPDIVNAKCDAGNEEEWESLPQRISDCPVRNIGLVGTDAWMLGQSASKIITVRFRADALQLPADIFEESHGRP